MVYDLGGGSFDVSVLRRRDERSWGVVASDGLAELGGVDLDAAIVRHLGETLGGAGHANWRRRIADGAPERHVLYQQVRAAKEQLSRHATALVRVPALDVDLHLTRDEFEDLARPYLERTVELTAATMRRAAMRPDESVDVFLVGGSSRVPLAGRLLHQRLGIAPTVLEQTELVVALGSVLVEPDPVYGGAADPLPGGPPADAVEPARTSRRFPTTRVLAVALVVALLLAGALSVRTGWVGAAGRSIQSLAGGQIGPHTVPISTTVWYAGAGGDEAIAEVGAHRSGEDVSLLDADYGITEVAERLGHDPATLMRCYSRVSATRRRDAARHIAELVSHNDTTAHLAAA